MKHSGVTRLGVVACVAAFMGTVLVGTATAQPGWSAASTLSHLSEPSGSGPAADQVPGAQATATIEVTVQGVSFSTSDGIPATTVRGSRYTARFRFVVSPRLGDVVASVSGGATTGACASAKVGPGVHHLSCSIRSTGEGRILSLTITMRTREGTAYAATYHHRQASVLFFEPGAH